VSFPYLDLAGAKLRSILRPSYFDDVEGLSPGFTAQSIATNTSPINSKMRKRYGGTLPWGQSPPALVPAGVSPPAVVLAGRPTLGSLLMVIQITTGGALGGALFRWSSDGGTTWTATGVATAASVPLGTTGMAAIFPAASYDTTNVYAAAPPVPETILRWLTSLVTDDVSVRHGINPNDPLAVRIAGRVEQTWKQLEEAANSKEGLWDLPASEDQGSAVNTGGPQAYAEQSPYTWQYKQAAAASREIAGVLTTPNKLVGG
jgi:hypothetical protein